jgi:hypothetical protein
MNILPVICFDSFAGINRGLGADLDPYHLAKWAHRTNQIGKCSAKTATCIGHAAACFELK